MTLDQVEDSDKCLASDEKNPDQVGGNNMDDLSATVAGLEFSVEDPVGLSFNQPAPAIPILANLTGSTLLESLRFPNQFDALCNLSTNQLNTTHLILNPACASIPPPPPLSTIELLNLKPANPVAESALSPSTPLTVVPSIGASLCCSDADIIDPWDGSPTAASSPNLLHTLSQCPLLPCLLYLFW
ncbi:hypothetical protein NE237_032608 [Protea cynaroides]|uniref:Uncharacterized protein n=1 Tax=Protea cynaroides TaxID=273540 RepID=A0A9Q0L4P9_9MAGN|nr:hypothetical protein NE237_032608 [Protea cynaroides]